ncbi:hypothetical protein G7Y89_g7827 [Cudoniella acicularis]|uniref:Uncharacterized protein n=1 Tax=Cudoniella acicularis TaxID=354080 RepID=A0A8H4W461_9HELO|nr:hypothetical protein G7Y89_g7827 [Cudoniella acicularis]
MYPQPLPQPPEDDVDQDDESPQSLEFVLEDPGAKKSNIGKVRSHVMKRIHQRARDEKKTYLKRATQQKNITLRPRSNFSDNSSTIFPKIKTAAPLIKRVEYPANNLVPYAWFEKDGPVLYVNRSKWPFPKPFQVTASDRIDDNKSVIPRQSHWMPYIRSPDYVGVKGAVLDLAVLAWIGQSTECFQFRVETIRWIQRQLDDPVSKISNATIGAIMTFTMWTAGSRDSQEMSSHMDAVEKIVDLRGGFETFIEDGPMVARLTSFDSIIAVLTGHPPRFPLVDYLISRPVTASPRNPSHHHESPLTNTGNFENIIKYHQSHDAIINCLQEMLDLTVNFKAHTRNQYPLKLTFHHQLETIIPYVKEPQHNYKTHLLTLPLISSCHNPNHNHVFNTLQSAATIYSRALTSIPSIDFPSSTNEIDRKSILNLYKISGVYQKRKDGKDCFGNKGFHYW